MPSILLLCLTLAACSRSGAPAPVVYNGSRPAATSSPTSNAPLQYHVVAPGQTLYGISRSYNLPLRALIDRNGLEPPYLLSVGQRLQLPTPQVHLVQRGDTVYGISRRYGVTTSELSRLNGLAAPFTIQVGQSLFIPQVAARRQPPPALQPAPVMAEGNLPARQGIVLPAPKAKDAGKPQQVRTAAVKPTPAPLPQPPRSDGRFTWPVRGKLISSFGPKAGGFHNDGINIAAQAGSQVRAAENGVVAYASDELKGFGNLLLIKHDGGWVTAYAHTARFLVGRGQTVKRGQPIALVGASGSVSSPQLHFELRKGSQAVDPLDYLPQQTSSR